MNIPAFIIVRDRIAKLPVLTEWLEARGATVILVDNDSKYPPCVEYLDKMPFKTYRLKDNHSKWAPWEHRLIELHPSDYFIVCDPDMYPHEECPDDAIEHWIEAYERYPGYHCVGPSYEISDLPASYSGRRDVVRWEAQFWARPIEGNAVSTPYFIAPIDSMFALFKRGGYIDIEKDSLRSNYPYVFRHQTWYMDTEHPTEEELFYISRCDPNRAHWVREVWPGMEERRPA